MLVDKRIIMNNRAQSGRYLGAPPAKGQAGFTLVEILVAMTIFAVAVLGLAVGATSVMRANQTSYFSTVATNLAQDKLEEIKARSGDYITSGGPITDTVNNVTFSRSWTVTDDSPASGVKRIDVTVTWTDYMSHTLTVSSAVKD